MGRQRRAIEFWNTTTHSSSLWRRCNKTGCGFRIVEAHWRRNERQNVKTACSTILLSVVRSASLAKGSTSKKRPSLHLHKVSTRSNKVSPRTFQIPFVYSRRDLFLGYLTTHFKLHGLRSVQWFGNCECWFGKMWLIWRYILASDWRHWAESHKISVRISGYLAEIRTRHLLNAKETTQPRRLVSFVQTISRFYGHYLEKQHMVWRIYT
jgi:hypothetical protein